MLQRSHRFHSRGAVQALYRRGRATRGALMLCKTAPRVQGELRFAVVVSTKVSKVAPVRNRIRRRIYELARVHLVMEQPLDMAITVFADSVAQLPAGELEDQFLQLCKQSGVMLQGAMKEV